MERYRAKHFDLSGLAGISDRTLEMHFKLYEGYVQQTNTLQARIATFLEDGHVDQEEMPAYSELKRRLGFEYNGMVLHEYYFANLKQHGGGDPARGAVYHAPRGRQRRGLRPGPRDGRLGARLPARLQAGGASEIHRRLLLERPLGGRRRAAPGASAAESRGVLIGLIPGPRRD